MVPASGRRKPVQRFGSWLRWAGLARTVAAEQAGDSAGTEFDAYTVQQRSAGETEEHVLDGQHVFQLLVPKRLPFA